jgi:hypothetical protein
MLFALVLHALYQSSQFEEGMEPRLLVGLFLAAGAVVWLGLSGARAMVDIVVAPVRRFGLRAVVALVLVALAAFIIVAGYVLEAFPNSGDELAYVLQAQTYAQGRLWVDPPPLPDAFRQFRFLVLGGKWVSQYSPGWAMILTPAAALSLPLWIVNPVIGAATLLAFFGLARRYVSRESAWIGVLVLGVSSFYILNSGSYFSHSLTALYGVMFASFGSRYIARGEIWCAVAAGVCIGLMGLTRTQNAAIFAVPFAIALATTPGRRTGLIWFGLGGAPFLAALLAYNTAITGNPLTTAARNESLGAPSMETLRLTVWRFAGLVIWTSPVLVVGYIIAFLTALARRRVDFTDWIMPLTVVFFLFYSGDGGNQYGPRYYFEGWPFAILTILKVIDPILFGAERSLRAAWIASALIASLLFEIGYLPARLQREHRVVVERQDVYAQAKRAGLNNAIVIIAGHVGAIRTMPPQDLVRNELHIGEQKIIYALDLGVRNEKLTSQFPGRSVYVYSHGRLQAAH